MDTTIYIYIYIKYVYFKHVLSNNADASFIYLAPCFF